MSLDLHRLAAAKLWLIGSPAGAAAPDPPRGLAYLSQALYALIPVASADVARISCDDRWRIYVNPDWLSAAGVPEVGRELAHVVWHLLGDHADRARALGVDGGTWRAWRLAADLAIGEALDRDALRPRDLPTPGEHGYESGLAAEQYFAVEQVLPAPEREEDEPEDDGDEHAGDGCGSGADGIPRPYELPPDADAAGVDRHDARAIRELVAIEFRDHGARRGGLPRGAERWINGVLTPEIPWEPVLAAVVRRALGWAAGRGEHTYSRPSRRAGATPGIVLPGQHRPVPRVSIVLDTSGSVDDRLLSRALGEIEGVVAALGVSDGVTVYAVDADAVATARVRRASDVRLAGGGGTDMRIGILAAQRERPRPDAIVVVTDGYTPWPATPPPGCVLVAALVGRRDGPSLPPTPEWVQRVECLLDDG